MTTELDNYQEVSKKNYTNASDSHHYIYTDKLLELLIISKHIIAMEVFRKKLITSDIEKHLVLPNDARREALPSFQGTRDIVLPIVLEQARTEVRVRCSSRLGRLAFTENWRDITSCLRLNAGDVVALRMEEDQGTVKYKNERVDVLFLLETKLFDFKDAFINRLWNGHDIKRTSINSEREPWKSSQKNSPLNSPLWILREDWSYNTILS
ncbi:unnamed protein product [Dovyalis caffra]|uniref:TF-B3 domain-containing protein n=1 Tax=Dovyalis caffra TaxID=77055 RepID=A0AAV1SWF8_9ROSI|nr:unnamed protein product [Dovyalis caffra]